MKYALCCGINNYGGGNNLQGCINDANDLASLFKNVYNFDDVKILLDQEVTHDNFIKNITEIYKKAKSGDVIVISYSGHGSQIPDQNGDEPDRYDEVICTIGRWTTDDELRILFDRCPSGVKLTFISDSCFSGTNTRSISENGNKIKYLAPTPDDIAKISRGIKYFVANKEISENYMKEILISGCSENQTSADAYIGGRFNGALTYFLIKAIQENSTATYNQCYKILRKYLPNDQYEQIPKLEGKLYNKSRKIFT